MSYLVFQVIYEVEKTESVLEAWQVAGISDGAVLHGKGSEGIRKAKNPAPFLQLPWISSFLQTVEIQYRVLFSIHEREELVDRLLFVSQSVIGELDAEKTGYMFVVPIVQTNTFRRKKMDPTFGRQANQDRQERGHHQVYDQVSCMGFQLFYQCNLAVFLFTGEKPIPLSLGAVFET